MSTSVFWTMSCPHSTHHVHTRVDISWLMTHMIMITTWRYVSINISIMGKTILVGNIFNPYLLVYNFILLLDTVSVCPPELCWLFSLTNIWSDCQDLESSSGWSQEALQQEWWMSWWLLWWWWLLLQVIITMFLIINPCPHNV